MYIFKDIFFLTAVNLLVQTTKLTIFSNDLHIHYSSKEQFEQGSTLFVIVQCSPCIEYYV